MKHQIDTMASLTDLIKDYARIIDDQKSIITDLEKSYEKLALEHEALQNKYNSLVRKKKKVFDDFLFDD